MTKPYFQKPPIVIDVEASGFDPHSYPIEIGVVSSAGERYSSLIKPYPDWTHWCEEAQLIHGISRLELHHYGKPGDVVAKELNELLDGQVVYSDGWVVDKPWLIKLFDRVRMPMSFWLSPMEMIVSEDIMAVWAQAKDTVGETFNERRHRASTDALFIQKIYVEAVRLAAIN